MSSKYIIRGRIPMKYNKILIIIVVFLIIFISCFYFTTSSKYSKNYYQLIGSAINEINIDIERLNHSDNLYATLISLTEIKQNCLMAARFISHQEKKNNELAIGDLLGYMFNYIDDIETEEINEQLIKNVVNELSQVNTIFSRVNISILEDKDEYFKLLVKELDINIKRYPKNEILNAYSDRMVPEAYK
ncbi:hypothetical protein [Paramaledivibacter caminithermalis]|nr:hypothetical protein [Paramaledivibacter caminithermalis]